MKIIDDKGRLFGRINVIDFIAILVLIAIIPMLFLGYKIFTQNPKIEARQYFEQEINCNFIKLKPEIISLISIGDRVLDQTGQDIGQILWIGEVKPYQFSVDLGENKKRIIKDQFLKQVHMKVKLKTYIKENNIYFNGHKLSYNDNFTLNTGKYTVTAVLMSSVELDIQKNREFIIMQCNLININPEILKMIYIGDKEIDDQGETIAEIVKLGESRPYQYQVYLGKEEVQTIKDLVLKEIPVSIKLKTDLVGNYVFYKNNQLVVNSPFEFKTNKYIVSVVPLSNKVEQWVKARVKFSGITPELNNVINKGHLEKDNTGKIIGVLSEIISIQPSQISALKVEENKLVFINDPYRTDIVAVLDLLCFEKEGTLYFKNSPVKIGSQIIFSSDIYMLTGSIVDITDSKK
ncbi:MAG: DUF4330 family protein [Candidatus Omnitrophota bacterium]